MTNKDGDALKGEEEVIWLESGMGPKENKIRDAVNRALRREGLHLRLVGIRLLGSDAMLEFKPMDLIPLEYEKAQMIADREMNKLRKRVLRRTKAKGQQC